MQPWANRGSHPALPAFNDVPPMKATVPARRDLAVPRACRTLLIPSLLSPDAARLTPRFAPLVVCLALAGPRRGAAHPCDRPPPAERPRTARTAPASCRPTGTSSPSNRRRRTSSPATPTTRSTSSCATCSPRPRRGSASPTRPAAHRPQRRDCHRHRRRRSARHQRQRPLRGVHVETPLAPGDAAACEYPDETGNCPTSTCAIEWAAPRRGSARRRAAKRRRHHHPRMSGDRHWIVFESEATNLVPGAPTASPMFLFDRLTGVISRVSVTSGGVQIDLPSFAPDVSNNGTSSRSSPSPCSAPIPTRSPASARRRRACGPSSSTGRPGRRAGPGAADRRQPCRRHARRALDDHVSHRGGRRVRRARRPSIAVNASSIASEITNSTGFSSESWIHDRTLGRVTQHGSGEPFASWTAAASATQVRRRAT